MLDPFVADAIAATDADVITVSVGVNLTGARSMDQRTFVPAFHGFIDRIRTQHPDTPIVVISSILWPGSEDVPGPSDVRFFDDGSMQCYSYGNAADIAKGALTLAESRRHLEYAVRVRAERGEAIAYLDGTRLYGESDVAEYPLPDGLHPDARLYQEIARRFTEFVFSDDGLVPRASL